MAGIQCRSCDVRKLSSEMSSDNLTEECDHPPLICLRCMLHQTRETKKCPFPSCDVTIPNEKVSSFTEKYERKFVYLFGAEALHALTLSIDVCTGNIFKLSYDKCLCVGDLLKDVINELRILKVPYSESGIRFTHSEKTFSVEQKDLTMEDLDIQPNDTIYTQLVQIQIPVNKEYQVKIRPAYSRKGEEKVQQIKDNLSAQEQKLKLELEEATSEVDSIFSDLSYMETIENNQTSNPSSNNCNLLELNERLFEVQNQIAFMKRGGIFHATCFIYQDDHFTGYDSSSKKAKPPQIVKFQYDNKKMEEQIKIQVQKFAKNVTAFVFVQSVCYGNDQIPVNISYLNGIDFFLSTKKESIWKLKVTDDKMCGQRDYQSVIICALVRDPTFGWDLIYAGRPCAGVPRDPNSSEFKILQENVDCFVMNHCVNRHLLFSR